MLGVGRVGIWEVKAPIWIPVTSSRELVTMEPRIGPNFPS